MTEDRYTAFAGHELLAEGPEAVVAAAAQAALASGASHVLVFDDRTGMSMEVDSLAATPRFAHVEADSSSKRGRGRPRLGVMAREVTLLPRHWDWLATQPGGASAALRRLVEDASRAPSPGERTEVLYRVLTPLAGDLPGYEDAVRALYRDDRDGFLAIVRGWPRAIGDYAMRLLGAAA